MTDVIHVAPLPYVIVARKDAFRIEGIDVYPPGGDKVVGQVLEEVEGDVVTVYYHGPKEESPLSTRSWDKEFSDREKALIINCEDYAVAPGGLPGHQLMLVVAKMAALLDEAGAE